MSSFELRTRSGQILKIHKELMRFGRGTENELVVNDLSVSKHHLNFYIRDGQLILEDAGSSNGFLVNGKLFASGEAVQVNPGDYVRIGNREFMVALPGQPVLFPKLPSVSSTVSRPPTMSGESAVSADYSKVQIKSGPSPVLLVAAAVFIGGALYMNLGGDSTAPRAPASVGENDLIAKLDTDAYKSKVPPVKSIDQIKSEAKYKEGMRDYLNQQYNRAYLKFYEAAIQDPENELAARYMKEADTRIENQVTKLYREGEKAFVRLQYKRTIRNMYVLLGILAEQIPGFGRDIASEMKADPNYVIRITSNETYLEKIVCEKIRTNSKSYCEKAKRLLKEAKVRMGEGDILRDEK